MIIIISVFISSLPDIACHQLLLANPYLFIRFSSDIPQGNLPDPTNQVRTSCHKLFQNWYFLIHHEWLFVPPSVTFSSLPDWTPQCRGHVYLVPGFDIYLLNEWLKTGYQGECETVQLFGRGTWKYFLKIPDCFFNHPLTQQSHFQHFNLKTCWKKMLKWFIAQGYSLWHYLRYKSLEPIQMPIIRRLAESAMVHSHSGILSGCKKKCGRSLQWHDLQMYCYVKKHNFVELNI